MKRNLTALNGAEVKAPEYPKAPANEFDAAMTYMVEQIAQRFRTQVFGKLHVSTVEKFADAQTGNYATVFIQLAKRAQRMLRKQFDDKRIGKITREALQKVDKRNRDELYRRIEKRTGISTAELTATEAMKATTNALMIETEVWAQKLRDETLQMFTANTLRAMSAGNSLEDVMRQFKDMEEKRKGHARMVARTQIANFNSLLTKTRAQNLGITKAIWVTSRDERVRESHKARDGKEFELSEGLYSSTDGKSFLPGTDYQCRCDYTLIIPEEDENAQ